METIDTPRVYLGAYAMCVKDGHLLLVRMGPSEFDAGSWGLPGGGLNWGEAPQNGMLRELTEETGLTGSAIELAGIFSTTYLRSAERPRDSVHYIGFLYFVDAVAGELQYEQDGSTDVCAWLPLADLDDLPLVGIAQHGRELIANRPATGPP